MNTMTFSDEKVMKKKLKMDNRLGASAVVVKRDIVKELEEKRRRRDEEDKKARKLKANLIKLEPLALREERIAREKEARQRIEAQVNFL